MYNPDLLFSGAHIFRTLFNLRTGGGSYLDAALLKIQGVPKKLPTFKLKQLCKYLYNPDLLFSRAHIFRTLFNIRIGGGSYLDGALLKIQGVQ